MDINAILIALLIVAGIAALIALAILFVELIKMMKVARKTVEDLKVKVDPLLDDVQTITKELTPAMSRVDPLMERVTLTVDSVNLEMMRVDQILEDLSEITDTASSATAAVDNITNAPVKMVNNVASKVKSAFGGKSASDESARLAEQRVAVAKALEDYKAAEAKETKVAEEPAPVAEEAAAPEPEGEAGDMPAFTQEPVIDPEVIANSPFFDEKPNEE